MTQTGHFIFDKNKCVGCEACVVACVNENGFQSPERWRNIISSNPIKVPGLPLFYLSMACNHCEDAPCLVNCPALAYRKSETGAIIHISDNCIGCKYCTWQCPYDAPKYNPIKGIIEKCSFCESRLLEAQKPACALLCPTGALDYNVGEIDKAEIIPDLNVPDYPKPSIKVVELENFSGPKIDKSLFVELPVEKTTPKQKSKITLLEELPLLLFTLISALMAGFSCSSAMSSISPTGKLMFLGSGVLAAALSTLHLGKKLRMWRSVLNIRRSWLSREILFFGLFMLMVGSGSYVIKIPFWIYVLSSALLCVSMDMLYQPAQRHWKLKIHSGQTLFIACAFYLLIQGFLLQFIIFTIFRIGILIFQYLVEHKKKSTLLFLIRLVYLLSVPVLIYLGQPFYVILPVFLFGEIIERISLYKDLVLTRIG